MYQPLTLITILLILINLFKPSFVHAIYFADDEIILYQNNQPITDDSVFHNRSAPLPICEHGICHIGQQSPSATLYITQDPHLLNYSQWIDHWYEIRPQCSDFITQKDRINDTIRQYMVSDEYQTLFRQMRSNNNVQESDRIQALLDKNTEKYVVSQGLTFYANHECHINYDDYKNVYLKNYINDPQTKQIKITIPPSSAKDVYCPFPCLGFGGRLGNPRTFKLDIATGNLELIKEHKPSSLGPLIIAGFIFVVLFLVYKKFRSRKPPVKPS